MNPFEISNHEKQKEKHAAIQFFRSLLECGGMRGYAKVKEPAAIMRQNQKNEEQTERRRGNHKEVCRDQFLGMIF